MELPLSQYVCQIIGGTRIDNTFELCLKNYANATQNNIFLW